MQAGPNYITRDQFDMIIEHVPMVGIRKWPTLNVQTCFRLAYWCALRMGEAISVRGKGIDWAAGEVYLGGTKTKDNYAPIPPWAAPTLREFFLEWGKDRPVLPGCTVRYVYKWLRRIGDDLDIEALRTDQKISGEKNVTHIFRKSMGKDMLSGVYGDRATISEVQAQLRHRNPVVTGRYLRLGHRAVPNTPNTCLLYTSPSPRD